MTTGKYRRGVAQKFLAQRLQITKIAVNQHRVQTRGHQSVDAIYSGELKQPDHGLASLALCQLYLQLFPCSAIGFTWEQLMKRKPLKARGLRFRVSMKCQYSSERRLSAAREVPMTARHQRRLDGPLQMAVRRLNAAILVN